MSLQMKMHWGVVFRFLICLCLVGFTVAKCDPEMCGSMNVSYPFWINNLDCGYPDFQIECQKDVSTGMLAPFLPAFITDNSTVNNTVFNYTSYKIMEINYTGYLIINSTSLKAWSCTKRASLAMEFSLPANSPFTISKSNMFVVIGSSAFGTYTYSYWGNARCVATCISQSDPPYCRYDCCENTLPDNSQWINFTGGGVFGLLNSTTNVYDRKCGFSTILDPSTFTVVDNKTDFFFGQGTKAYYGLRLNWGIGLQNCSTAKATANYSCSINAECIDSPSGQGHVCTCLPGYKGNAYSNGTDCTDIDECSDKKLNMCVGSKQGGSVSSFVAVSIGACGLIWCRRMRRLKHEREKNFRQNGGMQLQGRIASMGGRESLKIFSERELEIASNKYSTELGKGGFAIVYKGVLLDGTPVAIKRPKSISNEFLNEIVIMSHINHRNVVKLLGCCMETQFPLLVYEFVANGTVYEHLHSAEKHLSWETRRQIAIETAEAIAYMHLQASQPIFHRDIKSSNILLDNTFTPKVADFGISRLHASDERHLTTMHPSGTPGYVDPEFMMSNQFTDKSDVFSFGVVLVELLTGLTPFVSIEGSLRALYDHFLSAVNDNRLTEILDPKVLKEENQGQMENMANLAKACLQGKTTARPSMKEVVEELAWIRAATKQPGLYRDECLVEHRGDPKHARLNYHILPSTCDTDPAEDYYYNSPSVRAVASEGPSTALIQIEMSDTYGR